jgi:sugar (pentulose or hexulose) kinase
VQELWLAGGANRSPVWPQILADVCGVPLQISTYANWAALGAATLAGWGIGAYASLEEGLARLQPSSRKLDPDPALSGLYKERLEAYQRASAALNRTANRA